MNGQAWSRHEIYQLVMVVEGGGDLTALCARLERAPEALVAKAGRLQLKRVGPPLETLQSSPATAGCFDRG